MATATPQGANELASVLGRFVSFSSELMKQTDSLQCSGSRARPKPLAHFFAQLLTYEGHPMDTEWAERRRVIKKPRKHLGILGVVFKSSSLLIGCSFREGSWRTRNAPIFKKGSVDS